MTNWTNTLPEQPALPARNWKQALARGFRCRCPNCGEGRLFASFLKATPACENCGEDMTHHRADDAPPYITIFIVGHIVVPLNLMVERAVEWPLWLHMSVWPALALVLCLLLMQPVKGALIGYQWALRMHGFDPEGDFHAMPLPVVPLPVVPTPRTGVE
jgi:uncharacterized protein (DUF983 family)